MPRRSKPPSTVWVSQRPTLRWSCSRSRATLCSDSGEAALAFVPECGPCKRVRNDPHAGRRVAPPVTGDLVEPPVGVAPAPHRRRRPQVAARRGRRAHAQVEVSRSAAEIGGPVVAVSRREPKAKVANGLDRGRGAVVPSGFCRPWPKTSARVVRAAFPRRKR